MEKTIDFLKNRTENYFLATINGDAPSLRPFCEPVLFNGHLYAMTHAGKNVVKQIAENNNVCIVAYDGENWIRINCQMIDESDNLEAKKVAIAEFDWAEEAGYTLEAPDFVLYRIANAVATIYDEDGNVVARKEF